MKKKKEYYRPQAFSVTLPEFSQEILVCINLNEKEIRKEVNKKVRKDREKEINELLDFQLQGWDEDVNLGQMIEFDVGGYLILLKFEKDEFRKDVGSLVHEVTHVIQYYLRKRRVPLVVETEEIYASMTEYLVVEILKKLY